MPPTGTDARMTGPRRDIPRDSPPRRRESPAVPHALPPRPVASRDANIKRDRSPRMSERRDRDPRGDSSRRGSPPHSHHHRRDRSPSPRPRPSRDNRGRELFEDKLKEPPRDGRPKDIQDRSRGHADARPLSPRRPQVSPRRDQDVRDGSRARHSGRSISPLSSASKRQRSRSPLPYPSSRSKKSKRDRDRDRDRSRRHRIEGDSIHRDRPSSPRYDGRRSPRRFRSPSPRGRGPRETLPDRQDLFDGPGARRYNRSPKRGDPNSRRGLPERRRSRSPRGGSRHSSREPLLRGRAASRERTRSSRQFSPAYEDSRSQPALQSPTDQPSTRFRKRNGAWDEVGSGSSMTGANSIGVSLERRAAENRHSQDSTPDISTSRPGQSPSHANSAPSFHSSPRPRSPHGRHSPER